MGGPIAQYLWHKGIDVEDKKRAQAHIAIEIRNALLGANSYFDGSPQGKEILAVALGNDAFINRFGLSDELAIDKLIEKTSWTESIMKIEHDDLSYCITDGHDGSLQLGV